MTLGRKSVDLKYGIALKFQKIDGREQISILNILHGQIRRVLLSNETFKNRERRNQSAETMLIIREFEKQDQTSAYKTWKYGMAVDWSQGLVSHF